MFSLTDRTTLETEVEQSDTRYGFTWIAIDGRYRIRTPDDQFKQVPKLVIDTLREKADDTPIEDLIAEAAERDSGAADTLREMYEEEYIRKGAPVERVLPPDDVRLWYRVLAVVALMCLGGALWVEAILTLAQPVLDNPFGYLIDTVPLAIPLVLCSVVVHEFGHYYTAWRQGLDPEFGMSVINGVVPAVVTRTHGGWALPRNRRMWNTLAGPGFGLVWTLGVFGLYHAVLPHPSLAIAGVICFNYQLAALNPLFHGDGYLLLMNYLDERNIRTRGITDLRERRPTWQAAYAAASYGLVGLGFLTNVVIGYLLGDSLGAGLVLFLTIAIYAESRLEVVGRLRSALSPFGG